MTDIAKDTPRKYNVIIFYSYLTCRCWRKLSRSYEERVVTVMREGTLYGKMT